MKNEIIENGMSSVGTHQLRLPMQTAPVNRTLAASCLSGQDGVVPSFGWGDLWNIAKTALPAVMAAV
jgi:hypothetical protein